MEIAVPIGIVIVAAMTGTLGWYGYRIIDCDMIAIALAGLLWAFLVYANRKGHAWVRRLRRHNNYRPGVAPDPYPLGN